MQFRRADLADLTYFLEIAKHRNFRRAAADLGIGASALSHALRGLEERLGVRLLNRTSRSVTLTGAGEALRTAIATPFDEIGKAVDVLNRFRDAPMGRVRFSIPNEAADFLVSPVLPVFLERFPNVEVELSVSNRMIDVVDGGFDAGIRYGSTVPENMVALRVSADFRWIVVATPSYVERFGAPNHPDDLLGHRGVRIRTGDERIYRWEFERDGEERSIDVPGALTVDQGQVAMAAVKRGAALMYVPDFMVADALRTGTLTSVLDDWAPTGPGLHVYYSSRRQVPVALRLFVDLMRELRPLGL